MSSDEFELAYEYYPITGIQAATEPITVGANRKVPVRQNIDEWSDNKANKKQVDLFILALQAFQQIDVTERDSFFQVAGIHGEPFLAWDEPFEKNADGKGYCTHNNILFPIWHRPYLSLYEQRIYEIMIDDIVPIFPEDEQDAWREAADNWRLPFWDWGVTNRVPNIAKYPTTTVPTGQSGKEKRINNPLYQFSMPNGERFETAKVGDVLDPWIKQYIQYGRCVGTSRCPDEYDKAPHTESWRHGVVNNASVEVALKNPHWGDEGQDYGRTADLVYRLLTVPMEYSTFATTAQLDDNAQVQNDLNIEYLHNIIHGFVGGDFGGHMSEIPVATFDPLFWLHHCNIDRIFALWQALNPNKWFDKGSKNEFFQEAIGLADTITPQTPLRPFHKDTKGTVWTAEEVRRVTDLGYTYPELKRWEEKYNTGGGFSQDRFTKDIYATINDKYGLSRQNALNIAEKGKLPDGMQTIDGGLKANDYAFSVRYLKFALEGDPFWVRLYLAQGDGKPRAPAIDLVAEVYNFSQRPTRNGKETCENCVQGQDSKIRTTAYVSFTPILQKLLVNKSIPSLSENHVKEYLMKNVYWRVYRYGQELPRYEVDKLELEVVGSFNDASHFADPTIVSGFDNFKEVPELKGSGDGALDSKLKQPVVAPPPPGSDVPSAGLVLNKTLKLRGEVQADSIVIIDSPTVDLTQAVTNSIDNTQIWLSSAADIVFLMSVRRAEGEIVFNTWIDGAWGDEVRVPLENRFKAKTTTIIIHDQGDGFETSIDWVHVAYFPKRVRTNAITVSYSVNEGQNPVWAEELKVSTYPSMRALFSH